ncbi:M10 family metallopeptidase C-terminal domain-containing protein [Pseudomonas sp. MF7453]|uniref:M10 family metallopeptidase C-terminal domain-containing protein n=1 Tax=Pseudomonas sp. MF7453 TaxID=2797539 RepID=UPI0018E84FAD|nr:M10 family metallopeptidase C-terminal domain-containing protein [Pseudomonas sp. MF7453]MBJ2218389.1 M10 family metallopeptidase C-terminal domain-containing protein [Pseudomonas sp. MF7453]
MNIDPNIALARANATSEAHRAVVEIAHADERGNKNKYRQVSVSIDQVLEGSKGADGFAGSLGSGDPAEVTYEFANHPETGGTASQFTEAQKGVIRETLNNFSDAANIRFKESVKAQSHHMQFKIDGSSFKWQAPWYTPVSDDEPGRVQVSLNQRHADDLEKPNSFARHIIAKAVAFKLGLPDPASAVSRSNYAENTQAYTIRSPYLENRSDHRFSKSHGEDTQYSSAPMMDDIAVAQDKFGANLQTRTGDTTYGFNSNADRDVFKLESSDDLPVFCVWDADGNDTFDFSAFKQDQVINLKSGSFSNVGGGLGNVSIANGVTIERAIGGAGNDILIGNDVGNELEGGEGDDILYVKANSGFNRLTGGPGKNTFVIGANDSSASFQNTAITDFVSGKDKLDISALRAAHPRLTVTREYHRSHNLTLLRFDFDGDGKEDFMMSISGRFSRSDFGA